jgi:hypothetical protein
MLHPFLHALRHAEMRFHQRTIATAKHISAVCGLLVGAASSIMSAETEKVDYQSQIRPLLSDRCYACHGPDAHQRQADLRLDHADATLVERKLIVPHDPAQSELWRRITSDDPDVRMPPPSVHKSLDAEQIALIGRWIEQGAVFQRHWAFVSPNRPALPRVKRIDWPQNEIDFFTLSQIEAAGLEPAPRADRRTRLRRWYLDLTGLPPSPSELAEFENDKDPRADERWVDRLLDSPRFGERMAVAWLDQARYADTNGYSIDGGRHMWLWRDWVIDAYNRNKPFDEFVVEQLAGDLLPHATADQRVASGFNRNHMITHEGGTIPEENLVNYVADRVRTTGEVFLGLTMGCAQCHDHKFDPIRQQDYYRFFAYFNALSDRGLDGDGGKNAIPRLTAQSILGRDPQVIAGLKEELRQLQDQLKVVLTSQSSWEQTALAELRERGRNLQLHAVEVLKVSSPNRGGEYEVLADGTVFVPDYSDRSVSISAQIDVDNVTALRLVFSPNRFCPDGGLGHGKPNSLPGSFLLTGFSASATALPSNQVDLYRQLAIRTATASAAHPDFPPVDSLDERDHDGWSPHPDNQRPQHITFQLAEPISASTTPFVTVMLVWGGGPYGGGATLTGGQYRLYAVTGQDDGTNIPADVHGLLELPVASRTAQQQERLRSYYATVAPELANVRYRIDNLQQRIGALTEPQEVMVMDSAEKARDTFILVRGQYDQPGERVEPGTPDALFPALTNQPANRVGLARWLVHPKHPLTARVAVNRLWQMLYGTGLVTTSADFGSQGEPPTHPELLDWLAIEFVESGWDVKAMLKRMVLSATYQQSSQATPSALQRDPTNRLLARASRFRLQAEFVRDQALCVSGLLANRLGGPSVLPYEPPGLWKEISHYGSTPATAQVFVQDHGENLYRRSLYTFWKRTSPPSSLSSFDAPTREICVVQRSLTNTPLQALVLLNDPQYVEASRALAARILRDGGADVDSRLRFAFELVTARLPADSELIVLRRTLTRELDRLQQDRSSAHALLQVGESDRDQQLAVDEHAAWTAVASILLNLSETLTRG